MRNLILITILTLSLIFATACSKKDSNDGGIPAAGSISMKVDGNNWQASGANANKMTIGSNQSINIAGSHIIDLANNVMDTVTISIVSSSDISTGDYVWQNSVPYAQVTFNKEDSSPNATWYPKSGTVTVTKIDGSNIQGTFSATLERSGHPDITITDGGFNVNIMEF